MVKIRQCVLKNARIVTSQSLKTNVPEKNGRKSTVYAGFVMSINAPVILLPEFVTNAAMNSPSTNSNCFNGKGLGLVEVFPCLCSGSNHWYKIYVRSSVREFCTGSISY